MRLIETRVPFPVVSVGGGLGTNARVTWWEPGGKRCRIVPEAVVVHAVQAGNPEDEPPAQKTARASTDTPNVVRDKSRAESAAANTCSQEHKSIHVH